MLGPNSSELRNGIDEGGQFASRGARSRSTASQKSSSGGAPWQFAIGFDKSSDALNHHSFGHPPVLGVRPCPLAPDFGSRGRWFESTRPDQLVLDEHRCDCEQHGGRPKNEVGEACPVASGDRELFLINREETRWPRSSTVGGRMREQRDDLRRRGHGSMMNRSQPYDKSVKVVRVTITFDAVFGSVPTTVATRLRPGPSRAPGRWQPGSGRYPTLPGLLAVVGWPLPIG